jgi:hypothetical protein
MKLAISLFSLLLAAPVFAAGVKNTAQIQAVSAEAGPVIYSLDEKGTPRTTEEPKWYPTIKDFRDDGDYSDVCYVGSASHVRELLKELVYAADGDGDSYANLESIKKLTGGVYEVVVTIDDESGTNEETFRIPPCK